MKSLWIILIFLATIIVADINTSSAQNPGQVYEKGLIQEEGEGNLEAAIRLYAQIADNSNADPSLRAKALLHIGMCYEKMGTEEAIKTYQRLVDNYPAQKGEVAIARERLSYLIPVAEKPLQKNEEEDIVIRKLMEGAGSIFYGAPSPEGKYFSYIDYKTYPNDIVIKNLVTGNENRLRNQIDLNIGGDEGTPYNPIWSPDTKQIAYVWESDQSDMYEVRVVAVDNPKPKALIRLSYQKEWIKTEDWSPDGQHILVQIHRNDQDQIGLISTSDGTFHHLKTLEKSAPFSARFSYDGQFIAYDHPPNQESKDHDVYVLTIDGSTETKVTTHPSHDYLLDWAPGELKVLFASDRKGTNDMWSLSFDQGIISGKPTLITENIGNISPLGSTHYGSFYYSTAGSWWDIYTVNLDPKTGKVTSPLKEIQLPNQGYNRHATWSPDGQFLAYVSVKRHLRQPNILCLYDRKTGSIKEYSYENDVNQPTWFPDSQSILLFGSDALNIATGEIKPFVQLTHKEETYGIRIAPDSKYLYYITRNKEWDKHTIYSRNLETGEETEIYTTTDINLTISLSPDGQQLAVLVRHGENTRILKLLSTIDHSEKTIHSYKQDDFGYISTTWSPDGAYIYFSKILDDTWELCRIPSNGGDVENLGVKKHLFTGISFQPGGDEISFTSFVGKEKPGGVWVMENYLQKKGLPSVNAVGDLPKSMTLEKVWSGGATIMWGSPSPNGKFMTYSDPGSLNLALHELSTGETKILTNDASEDPLQFNMGSVVSPNNKQIAYAWFKNNHEIRIIDVDNPQPKTLYGNNDENVWPCAWSADGKTIYARSILNKEGKCRILAVDAKSGMIQVLKTFDKIFWLQLSVSPDNRFIAYNFPTANGDTDVHLISTDGNTESTIVKHPANDRLMDWFPDNNQVLFKSDRSGTWDAWAVKVFKGNTAGEPEKVITEIGQNASALGFTKSGTFYYSHVSRKFNGSILPLDQKREELKSELVKPLLGSISDAKWSPDGKSIALIKELWMQNKRPFYILDVETGKEQKMVDWLIISNMSWLQDNETILIRGFDQRKEPDKNYSNALYTINTKTGEVSELLSYSEYREKEWEIGLKIAQLMAEGNNNQNNIYYLKNGQLISRELATGMEKTLLEDNNFNSTNYSLELSPDKKNLLFYNENQLFVIPLTNPELIPIVKRVTINTITVENNAVWTPAGSHVLYAHNTDDGSALWKVSAKGEHPKEVWKSKFPICSFSIHPDGDEIVITTLNQYAEIWKADNLLSNEKAYNLK